MQRLFPWRIYHTLKSIVVSGDVHASTRLIYSTENLCKRTARPLMAGKTNRATDVVTPSSRSMLAILVLFLLFVLCCPRRHGGVAEVRRGWRKSAYTIISEILYRSKTHLWQDNKSWHLFEKKIQAADKYRKYVTTIVP